jgi:hypothetical protein
MSGFSRRLQPHYLIVSAAIIVALLLAGYNQNFSGIGLSFMPIAATQPDPTLSDFWLGNAIWVLEINDTGLPVGESDTLLMPNGELWSYLHASTQSAGITDSCGDPVEFPGCVTRWVSTDGGVSFSLPQSTCLLDCDTCPCDKNDRTWQQQYPRITRAWDGRFYMVFEHGAAEWITRSRDGLRWSRPFVIPGTGTWTMAESQCKIASRIGEHPFVKNDDECMAGGPPGIVIEGNTVYVFVGLGQNPASMGCFRASIWNIYRWKECGANPLFSGAAEYGPLDALGLKANPYFDFRTITSADVILVNGMYYMAYEGVRGPHNSVVGRDSQFGLGFARANVIDGKWKEYPGNPLLDAVMDNWGISHADLLVLEGRTYMYTATPQMARGRYMLVWK